ncbi:MAG: alpha/beta hydrolase [Oscillospiraceae bacterium]|nr:alpha/beta hydrolase [Oscillospiraceae bacterium]MDY2847648.1 alpha/beta hydrolase [Oscillospiraceae bacterium]
MNYSIKEMPCKSENNTIFGVMYLPAETTRNIPAVILSHGYNSSYSHVTDIAGMLAENGIGAYCYDFCGGSVLSKSGGSSTDMSVMTEQEDLKNVIRMIKTCGFADNERIFLYGESQGGFVSALTAAEMPADIAGMVLLYPAFCIPDNWLTKAPEDITETLDFMGMTLSDKFYREVPRYDVYEHIAAFDKPVLVFHGTSDTLVDISYSKRICKAFPNCTLDVYENEGHGFSPEARRTVCEKTADFFAKLSL